MSTARVFACRGAALGMLLLGVAAFGASAQAARATTETAAATAKAATTATVTARAAAVAESAAAPLPAESPIQLERVGQITDKVGALGDRRVEVASALAQLDAQRGIQLFVAYVRDFSGTAPADWANETAAKSGLGLHDVLLAVATHARSYGYSTDTDSGVTPAQMASVAATAVEPALRQNDWAGAAIGAAQGIGAVVAGGPIPTVAVTPGPADPGRTSSWRSGAVTAGLVVVIGGLGALGVFAYSRKRQRGATHSASGPVPLTELDATAKHTLVATDDAVRTSEEELSFASAEFGDEATEQFADALADAKAELTAAFRIRQALDDEFPEDEPTRRRMLTEIVERCRRANDRLDAEVKAFDRLRALVQHAPQALATALRAAEAQQERVAPVLAAFERMRAGYADSATAPLAGHPQQITDRLAFADDCLGAAGVALDAADRRRAAVLIRGAEAGIEQAQQLLDAVDRRGVELDTAALKLPAALAEMESDLAEARAVAGSWGAGAGVGTAAGAGTAAVSVSASASADLAARAARAEQVVTALRAELTGRYDPIDALRRAEEADALLDGALNAVREQERNDRRARSLLEQATMTARSEIAAAEDFVTTRRGAVGSRARTRLAEAKRLLQQSAAAAGPDAAQALVLARQADQRAREALASAQHDADQYRSPYGGGRSGDSMGGAVLGGIILGDLLSGSRGRGWGAGRGGWSMPSRGGFGSGGGGPGSFGGGGTRGRLGGGGRF